MVLTRTRSQRVDEGAGTDVHEAMVGDVGRPEEARGDEAGMSGPVGVGRAQEQDEQQDQEQEKRMDHQEQALRSPLLASQRPEFRTMSIDSQQFLQHALSVDGEALQQYLEHETGAHFMRLSPVKQSGLGVAAGHGARRCS